ncbi:PIG-X [Mycena pura]|uniref:Protein PBN1 n=1 Tax=Mycena pura TaxID=153505 RepID=A0AAD6YFU6_9AGAR|nr:PIG-X [Mycena pura]
MQTSSLAHPQSFHPVFQTTISARGFHGCSLHLYYALPALIFCDPYELSNRADAYSFQHAGPSNLELPVAALDPAAGNASLLLSITPPKSASGELLDVEVEVPLHVRYGAVAAQTANGSSLAPFQRTELPWPEAFFACPARTSTDALPPMPPALAAPFGTSTIFVLKTPEGVTPVEVLETPVGAAADVRTVELWTAVVVMASFFYLVQAMRRTVVRMRASRSAPTREKNE